jgi:hypothetical protein
MGQTSENFLPSASGQTLGNSGQRWNAYLQDLFLSRSMGLPEYTISTLPTPGTGGKMAYVSNGGYPIWIDNGTSWVSLINASIPQLTDFGIRPDGGISFAASIASGSTILNISGSDSTPFTVADEGKIAVIPGAGASSATLVSPIASFISSTQVNISTTASTTVTSGSACWGNDYTTEFDTAFDQSSFLFAPPGNYGATILRLRQGQHILGKGFNGVRFLRLGVGASGPFMSMLSGQTAEHLFLNHFTVWCNQLGTNLNGIELGTETPGNTNFATGSLIDSVRVHSASGIAMHLESNAGQIRNIWLQNGPTIGTPAGLSAPNTVGLKVTGNTLSSRNLHIEGRFEGEFINSAASGSVFDTTHLEVSANAYATKDVIDITDSNQYFDDTQIISLGALTRRDLVRISASSEYITLHRLIVDTANGAITATNGINNLNKSTTRAVTTYTRLYYSLDTSDNLIEDVYTKQRFNQDTSFLGNVDITKPNATLTLDDTNGIRPFQIYNQSNTLFFRDQINGLDILAIKAGGTATWANRMQLKKGATVTAANDLTLGADGNVFHVAGATTINAIAVNDWQAGSEVTLIFDSTPTVKHNTSGSSGFVHMFLAGAVDFSATANDVLTLVYDGVAWYETGRTVI